MNCYLMGDEEKKTWKKTTVSASIPCHVENRFSFLCQCGVLGDFVYFLFVVWLMYSSLFGLQQVCCYWSG